MKKYGLHGKLKATPGNGDKLANILLNASKLVATAKGCSMYMVSMDRNDVDTVWVTEVWESKDDHNNSLKVEGVKELISEAMPLLEGQPEKGQELDIIGGTGLK